MDTIATALTRIEAAFGGTFGVRAEPLHGGEPVAHRPEERFPGASTIKVYVLLDLLERVAAGDLGLEDELTLGADDRVAGSGVLKALTPGRTYTLRDLATLMIIVSDNTATNLLIDRLGVEAINERCLRHGWHGTRLFGKLQTGDATETSHTTPADLCSYFAQLWRGDLLPPALTGVAQDIFRRQQLTDGLGGDLDYDRYSTETGASQLIVASKSGSIRGVRNDAGVIELAGRGFVVAVMTKGGTDPRFYPGNPGVRTIAKVARALYDHFGLSAEQSA